MSVIPDFDAMSYEDGLAAIDNFYGPDDTASPSQRAHWTGPAVSPHDAGDDVEQQHLEQSSPAISVQGTQDPASSGYSQFGTPAESGQS